MACPICNRKSDATLRPFCSKRCADVDLAKWLSGEYAIPTPITEADEDVLAEFDRDDDRPH